MSEVNSIPSEVVFAQKASAIVKAAGMDPRSMDLESFRAYIAIFKEHLLSDVESFDDRMGKDEQMLNAQLVIDGLYSKTKNTVLSRISGEDIYSGNHRAIGALVGILFAEGQRMWQKKMKLIEDQQNNEKYPEKKETRDDISLSNTLESGSDVVLHKNRAGEPEDIYPPIVIDDDNDSDVDVSGLPLDKDRNSHLRESLQSLKNLQTSNNVPPKELEKLLQRIEYLENLVKKQRKVYKPKMVKRREKERERPAAVDYDRVSEDESEPLVNGKRREIPRYRQNRIVDDDRHLERHMKVNDDGRKSRPTSAPTGRRTPQPNRQHHFPAPSNTRTADEPTKKDSPQHTPRVPKAWGNLSSNELYTYDMRSGRRIPVSQAEFQAEERRRKREAMGNIKAMADMDNEPNSARPIRNDNDYHDNNNNNNHLSGPTRAEWPGKSTGRSVEEYLQRMRKLRGETDTASTDTPSARYYGAYQKLEKTDLVISVEHCWNCEHHNVSLRHNPHQYVSVSDNFLRSLAQVVHGSGVKARVGVSRFKADITPKSKMSDVDSRIGSCEIQVAYKLTSGEIVTEVLHSKLVSQRWPSKSVVEKRLQAFLSKLDIPHYNTRTPSNASPTMCTANCADPYPVGLCLWEDTPLEPITWSFVAPKNPAALRVQWVFDYRSMDEMELPKCQIGSMVKVLNVPYKWANVDRSAQSKDGHEKEKFLERFALSGVVREYVSHSNGISVKVRLKYTNEDVDVGEAQCILAEDYEGPSVELSEVSKAPLSLDVLFHLAKGLGLLQWTVVDVAGDNEDFSRKEVYLSRASFFMQVRNMCWAVEKAMQSSTGKRTITHPVSGEIADMQLSYSEEVMQWVFSYYGKLANVTALEIMVLDPYRRMQPKKAVAEPLEQSDRKEERRVSESSMKDLPAPDKREESPEEELRGEESKTSSRVAEAKASPRSESVADTTTAAEKKSADRVSPRPTSNLTQPIPSPRNHSQDVDERSLAPSSPRVEVLGSPVKNDKYDFVAFDSDEEGEGEASVLTIPNLRASDDLLHPPVTKAVKEEEVEEVKKEDKEATVPLLTTADAVTERSRSASLTSSAALPISARSESRGGGSSSGAGGGGGGAPSPVSKPATARLDAKSVEEKGEGNIEGRALTYQNKDVVFISIIIEGEALEHERYDSAQVIMDICGQSYVAGVCLAREKGSKRRSFNVNWGDIYIPADSFRSEQVLFSVIVTDKIVLEDFPSFPSEQSRGAGQSYSAEIPLKDFMRSYFEVSVRVKVPVADLPGHMGAVSATIHGHAHEAKETRAHRIMSMRAQELAHIKFDPLPKDDVLSEDDYSDDLEEAEEDGEGTPSSAKKPASVHRTQSARELTRSLFPKASHNNLLASLN